MSEQAETRPVLLQIKVKPNARQSVLEETGPGVWIAHLKAPPADGKANAELLALVARQWGLRRSAVSLKSGASSRIKWVRIDDC